MPEGQITQSVIQIVESVSAFQMLLEEDAVNVQMAIMILVALMGVCFATVTQKVLRAVSVMLLVSVNARLVLMV